MPFIQPKASKPPICDVDSSNILPLYTIIRSSLRTIFYARNCVIYFQNTTLTSNEKIVPFYDYQTESYHLTKLNYTKTGYIESLISKFKATNGDIYFIYSTRQKDGLENDIVVYNYTKDIVIYRKKSEWLDTLTLNIPILNSLLVLLSKSGYDIGVRIIDVTAEKEHNASDMDLFIISLKYYFVKIIELMEDKISEKEIRSLHKIANDIASGHLHYENVQYLGVPEIVITASIYENDTVFYKGFQIHFSQVQLQTLNVSIHRAFSVSFMFEENNIVIQLGTGEGGYIVTKGNFINIPPNVYWFVDEYKLKNKHDLTNSKLYSVSKVSKEYIIINNEMYYSNPYEPRTFIGYKTKNTITYMFNDEEISILNIGYSDIVVVIGLLNSKISYKAAILITKKTDNELEIININEIRNKIKQVQNEQDKRTSEILEVSKEFIKNINVREKILEALHRIYKKIPINKLYNYLYYVDEENGYMYCLAVHKNEDKDESIIFLKLYLLNSNASPEIIARLEIKYDELKNNPMLLHKKILNFMAHQDGNKLILYGLILRYVRNRIYNYLNEIIIEMNYPLFMLKDIKYNRLGAFKYYNEEFKEIDSVIINPIYSVIRWLISGKMGSSILHVNVLLIVSELIVSKKMA